MNRFQYTYSIVRYVHDPAAGEILNVGVILCAPALSFIGAQFDYHYERLSETFANFDGDHYKRALRRFEDAIEKISARSGDTLFKLKDVPQDAASLAAILWPDKDLSFQIGPVLAGVSDRPVKMLETLFDRMVTSQYTRRTNEKRTDDEIWKIYQRPLTRQRVSRVLQPKKITTDKVELKFEHTFKNEHLNILQPLSFDLVKKESMQRKAAQWLGVAMAIKEAPDVGKLYLLLGEPKADSSAHRTAYAKAKKLLDEIPIKHELIEEGQAEGFATELAKYMKQHGVIKREDED
jgi:Protein of unknown function (DUF3037).